MSRRTKPALPALIQTKAFSPYSYKLYDDLSAFDGKPGRVELNKTLMTASAIFATATRDRQGDILEIAGIQTANHQPNPIVLWDHGRNYSIPIGVTRSPAGQYTVECDPEMGQARQETYFSQSDRVAAQIYALIDEGVINANSFGFREIDIARLPPDPAQNLRGGKHIRSCDLLEVSWTPVPANAECVRPLLERGTVEGKSLAPCIKSLLLPYALPKRAWSSGVTLGATKSGEPDVKNTKAVKTAQSALDESTGGALRKGVSTKKPSPDNESSDEPGGGEGEVSEINDDPSEHDENVQEGAKDEASEGDSTQDETSPDDAAGDDEKAVEPPSASLMRDLHADMHKFHGVYSKEAQLIEHPQAKEHFTNLLTRWQQDIEDLAAVFGEIHEELEPLMHMEDEGAPETVEDKGETPDAEAETDDLEEGAEQVTDDASDQTVETEDGGGKDRKKSFTKSEHETITDVKDILEELSQNEGMSKTHRAALAHHIGRIKEMCARYQKTEVTPDEIATAAQGQQDQGVQAKSQTKSQDREEVRAEAAEESVPAEMNPEEKAYLDRYLRALDRREHVLNRLAGVNGEAE